MCGALLLATLLNYMDRQALSETATELKAQFHLDDGRYGTIERGFSWAFAVGSVLFGFLADRFGPRRLYPVVLVGWSLAGVATTFAASEVAGRFEGPDDDPGAGTFRWLLLCRTVLGLFEAGHWPCALITARQVLTAADRPFGNSLLQSGASAGAVLTPLYVLLVRSFGGGWQVVFWTVGVGGLLWVPLWFALVRRGDLDDKPTAPPDPELDEAGVPHGPGHAAAEPFDAIGFVRRFVVLAVVVTCLGVSWQFIRAWLPKYLKEFHGYTPAASAWAVALYYIAADLGCILAGFGAKALADRGRGVHASRVLVYALWCGLTALAAMVPQVGGNFWVLVPVLMLVGAGVLGLHPMYYALAQELPAKHMGLLSGTLAAMTWFTVGAAQGAIGAHIKATGSYDIGFVLAGLAPLAGLAALLVVWPRGEPRPQGRG